MFAKKPYRHYLDSGLRGTGKVLIPAWRIVDSGGGLVLLLVQVAVLLFLKSLSKP